MQIVELEEPLIIRGARCEAGVPYVMNDTGAGSLLTNRELVRCRDGMDRPIYRLVGICSMRPRPLDPAQDYNGRSIWLFRGGGWGDLLMMTPTIREIKRRWPKCRVVVVTMPEYEGVFDGLDCEAFYGFVPLSEMPLSDPAVCFEGVIEDSVGARERHGVRIFADHAGISDLADKRIHYQVTDSERDWAESFMPPRSRTKRVGIQAAASSGVRTYPPALLVEVLQRLLALDYEPVLFGKYQSVDCDIAGVINLSDYNITFRQSCAVLAQSCDAVVVPDSSLQHVAGAIGIPTVALFGSFPYALRRPLAAAAETVVLEASASCAPCFHHESGKKKFPSHGPCNLAGFCTVLGSIRPEKIVAAVAYVLGEQKGLPPSREGAKEGK